MTIFSLDGPRGSARHLPAWVDYGLFWTPGARRPGLLGFGLYLVRATVWPVVLSFVVLAPFAAALPRHRVAGIGVMLGFAVLVEECGRYGFARRADNPIRALVLFTFLVIAVETAVYWRGSASIAINLALRGPSMLVHVAASLALLYGLRHRSRLIPIAACIFIGHLAFDVATVALFGDQLAHAKGLSMAAAASSGRS